MAGAILVAGYLGMNPPGFAAQVVALAFGLAASSIFPALMMGIFNKKMNREGAIVGMLTGLAVHAGLHLLVQGLVLCAWNRDGCKRAGQLVHGNLARILWCRWCLDQLRMRLSCFQGHRSPAGAYSTPGGRYPRADECGCSGRSLIEPALRCRNRASHSTGPFCFVFSVQPLESLYA